MNDPISWDPSLVKKYNSSNHYKLLNQLRNEVRKYPLNNKKKTASHQRNDTKQDDKNQLNTTHIKNSSFSINSNQSNDVNIDKPTVSFNNAKNFSIYNQSNSNNRLSEINPPDPLKSNLESQPPTFKDRLNQIEMK